MNEAELDQYDDLSKDWRKKTLAYVSAMNNYIQRGIECNWEGEDLPAEPKETRKAIALDVLEAVRAANQTGHLGGLRDRFPPAHSPFVRKLEKNGQDLPVVLLLADGRIVLRVGAPYEAGYVAVVSGDEVTQLPNDIFTVGRSPNRKVFAKASGAEVTLHDGWDGAVIARLPWPDGTEGMPAGFHSQRIDGVPTVTKLVPYDSGDRALLVSPEGVFVLESERAVRLLPTPEELQEHFEWLKREYPEDTLSYDLDMDHGALSPNGRWIACGHQSSEHYLFDANTYEVAAKVGNLSEYPHFALFSNDSQLVALNSCHFYAGETLGVPLSIVPGLVTKRYEVDKRLVLLEDGARVYAGVYRNNEFIIGDAGGYLRAFDGCGNSRWRHFIGSSMGDIDISEDGKTLVATTYAGFLSIIEMDTGNPDPFAIGNGGHRERRRWLFWKNEPKPLIW
ncbi:MAG: hypothetical protein AAGD11_04750 [Planctomycetota bacterium]